MRVKVVKWCRKKWNEHNLMYVYHKECEIKQKNNETAQTANFTDFPLISCGNGPMVHNGPKLSNGNAFFSYWKILLRYPGYAICKLTSRAFWKCNGFPWWDVLNQSYDSKTVVRWDPPPLDHPTIICVFWPENSHILDSSSARVHGEGRNDCEACFAM